MPNLPALSILIFSFLGMVFMIVRKWPELQALKLMSQEAAVEKSLRERLQDKMAGIDSVRKFSTEKVLKRILMRTKILLLKGERRTDQYLRKISHSKKFKEDYWEEIDKE